MLTLYFQKSCLGLLVVFSFLSLSWTGDLCESPYSAPDRITISNTEGRGLGYNKGYSSLDIFLSQHFWDAQLVPFIDLRGHIFNNERKAVNAGLGLRWLNEGVIWGINGYYDYLQTTHLLYRQASIGFEALSDAWEVRMNGYLPFGIKETGIYEISYELTPTTFLMKSREAFAMAGVDAEFGYHFFNFSDLDIYTGLGPYFYRGHSSATENVYLPENKYAIGGRLRASVSFLSYFTLEGLTTYDSRFKWGGQVTLAISLPFDLSFDLGNCRGHCRSCEASCCIERLYQPVYRNEIIVVDRLTRYSDNPEILDPEFEP